MPGDDNSGIFIGFPPSTDPWSAVNNGYEIQIDATDAADRTTGSVYTLQVGRHRRPRRRAQPAGGVEHLRAAGRGRAAADLPQRRADQRLHQHRPGALAGRATSASRTTAPATTSSFRNIRIKELGTPPPRRHDRPGRVVQLGQRRAGRSPRPAPTTARPSATSTRATGRPTTGVNLDRRDHVPGPRRLRRRRAARSRSAPVRRPARPRHGGGAQHRQLDDLRQRADHA